jgi:hypothetical protein
VERESLRRHAQRLDPVTQPDEVLEMNADALSATDAPSITGAAPITKTQINRNSLLSDCCRDAQPASASRSR